MRPRPHSCPISGPGIWWVISGPALSSHWVACSDFSTER